jgi:hypothetical protein
MTARWSNPHRLPVPPNRVRPRRQPHEGSMSEVELALAFLSGVVMGILLDR